MVTIFLNLLSNSLGKQSHNDHLGARMDFTHWGLSGGPLPPCTPAHGVLTQKVFSSCPGAALGDRICWRCSQCWGGCPCLAQVGGRPHGLLKSH